ncbi:hypothetical protein IEQ34_015022 [Dendrobium chrysotoxum]|uniref:Uncharacterized protein n=1 Tax=Dendrobium chrysotoxum TaxID=161865 RepID=A0AAV7GNC5_DENCH|nr:hypothetical protein IEQ34_015022 [Dendrobium chrysotoxum]
MASVGIKAMAFGISPVSSLSLRLRFINLWQLVKLAGIIPARRFLERSRVPRAEQPSTSLGISPASSLPEATNI